MLCHPGCQLINKEGGKGKNPSEEQILRTQDVIFDPLKREYLKTERPRSLSMFCVSFFVSFVNYSDYTPVTRTEGCLMVSIRIQRLKDKLYDNFDNNQRNNYPPTTPTHVR